tara:strand:- start:161 stop:286 length:126 start_codon:yes stop_codon:yes gene_type:complete
MSGASPHRPSAGRIAHQSVETAKTRTPDGMMPLTQFFFEAL